MDNDSPQAQLDSEKKAPRAVIDGVPVFCRFDDLRDIDAMVENPRNPNKHPKCQLERLATIIKNTGWRAPITVSAQSGFIVKGHGRLQAAKLAGFHRVPVEVQNYASRELELADLLADNRIAELAEIDNKELDKVVKEIATLAPAALDLTGFSADELDELFPAPKTQEEDAYEIEQAKMERLELTERMEKAKYVFFAFSGGRDSTRALISTYDAFVRAGKICEVIYIENTCEFPDLIMHIRKVCSMLGAKLTTVHPEKTYLTEYYAKGKSPDSLYMDCVEILINQPMDKYIESVVGKQDYILVRGGQPKQKTIRSGTAELQKVKSKPNMIIYNPFFTMTPEHLQAKIPEWPGYAAGFVRTACWCCPFQKAEQYEAMRKNYPLLHDQMKHIMGSIVIKDYGVDSYTKKYRYWEQYGVKLKWNRYKK